MGGFEHRVLGKTGLRVSPLGIGGGGGIDSADLLYAFERGINYFFYSADFHHETYRPTAAALRELCGAGSCVREEVVLATVSYVNDPDKLIGVLVDQFHELGVDYIDIFHWGWVGARHADAALFDAVHALKGDADLTRRVRTWQAQREQAAEVNEELLRRGLVRFVGASFHERATARQWLSAVDVLMVRYNMAHAGVETLVFPGLCGDPAQDPGVVVFNTAHSGRGMLYEPPPDYPPHMYVPWPPDCYRWALTHPAVDLVLTGMSDRHQVDAALAAMERGPMTEAERAALRKYGDLHIGRLQVKSAGA
jgi:predicted aldo/keto reductase-like oxidoreductase